jgi:hypothetical protein
MQGPKSFQDKYGDHFVEGYTYGAPNWKRTCSDRANLHLLQAYRHQQASAGDTHACWGGSQVV